MRQISLIYLKSDVYIIKLVGSLTYSKNAHCETSRFILKVCKHNLRYLYLDGLAIKFTNEFPLGVIPFNTAVLFVICESLR